MYCSTPCLAVLSCLFFSALCNVVLSYNVFYWSAVCHAVLCSAVLYTVVLCCATVYAAVPSSTQLFSTMLTLRCSWSWAWCWRVSFSCCFWNSLISSCFWICCCFWMRSSSCCSCLSHSPGSEPGPSILRSVRRSSGDKGSTVNGTSGLMSTVAGRSKSRENKREKEICQSRNFRFIKSFNQRWLCLLYLCIALKQNMLFRVKQDNKIRILKRRHRVLKMKK